MNCQEAREQYSDYIDCCLGDRQDAVDSHLDACPECKRELLRLRKILNKLNCLPQIEAPTNFIVKLNERLDEMEKPWYSRALEYMTIGTPSRALALAASFALVIVAAFYFDSQKVSTETAENNILQAPRTVNWMAPTSPTMEPRTERSAIPVSTVADTEPQPFTGGPLRPVSLGGSYAAIPESVPLPGVVEVDAVTSSVTQKVPYVDGIVLLRASNPAGAAQQVRRAADSFSGQHLDYSENVIFASVLDDNADLFLQALETMGNVEIVTGPIDRGLPTTLFQVVVIPSR